MYSDVLSDASLPAWEGVSFPGFGEDAPLNLPDLGSEAAQAIAGRIADGSFTDFAHALAGAGNCSHPIRLRGGSQTLDAATGEVLSTFDTADLPFGVAFKPCGNRREHVCPACSRVYARDTFEVIRNGALGGKTIPETVADNPLLFVTLTGPSFGLVHGGSSGRACRPRRRDDRTRCLHGRPLWCNHHHEENDPGRGTPLCHECYDYETHVVWQWWAPELWRRFTINVRRGLAGLLGVADRELREVASIQFAKVAEYQERGVIHFHALLRLDGPAEDGIGSPAPDIPTDRFIGVVTDAAKQVKYVAPPVFAGDMPRRLVFGQQLDVRLVRTASRTDDPAGSLSTNQVAGYLAKYATKDARNAGGRERRPTAHVRTLRETCQSLCELSLSRWGGSDNPYFLLGKWEHALGFRGHFSSKSRRYSVTLGALRRARARWRQVVAEAARRGEVLDTAEIERRVLAEGEDTTLVVGQWWFAGSGWPRPGDAELATAAAVRAREYDQWRANRRKSDELKEG